MKAVVAAFNQEKALVGAFSVITNLRMELFQALQPSPGCAGRQVTNRGGGGGSGAAAPPLQDSGHRARSGDNTTVSGSVLY